MQRADPIAASLELAGERCPDLTPLVYARLFAAHPDMKPLFASDKNDAAKGEMLARVITAILDFIGERVYAHTLIQSEVLTHNGYGVPPAIFGVFFAIVRDGVREVCAEGWTAEMEAAWRDLLAALDAYVKQGASDAAAA